MVRNPRVFGTFTLSLALTTLFIVPAQTAPSGTSNNVLPGKLFGLKHMVTAGVQARKLFAKAPEEWRSPIIGSDGSLAYVATNSGNLTCLKPSKDITALSIPGRDNRMRFDRIPKK